MSKYLRRHIYNRRRLGKASKQNSFDPRFTSSGKVDKVFAPAKFAGGGRKQIKRGESKMGKLFIRILVLICLGVAIWSGYVFFHGGATLVNGVILVVDIGVLIWNFSVMRKMHIRFSSVILTGVILAIVALPVAAFAGVEPMASFKDKIASNVKSAQVQQETTTAQQDSKELTAEQQLRNLGLSEKKIQEELAKIANIKNYTKTGIVKSTTDVYDSRGNRSSSTIEFTDGTFVMVKEGSFKGTPLGLKVKVDYQYDPRIGGVRLIKIEVQ